MGIKFENGQWVPDNGGNEQLLALNTVTPATQNTSTGGTNAGSNSTSTQQTDKQEQPEMAKTEPEPSSQAQLAYEQAQKERDEVNQQNLATLRDLVDRYKPETPEEKEKRERFERTRNGIAALSSMGAALGNLVAAAGSRDGRAVSTPNLSEPAAQATERDRKIREQRDAKGIELRNRYHAMRQNMADQKVKDTWTAWQAEQADKQAKAKLEAQNQQAKAKLAFENFKFGQQHELALLKEKNANNRAAADLALKRQIHDEKMKNGGYGNGAHHIVKIATADGVYAINVDTYKTDTFMGGMYAYLPEEYKERADAILGGMDASAAGYNAYNERMQQLVGEFLRRGVRDGDSEEYKKRYQGAIQYLKDIGGATETSDGSGEKKPEQKKPMNGFGGLSKPEQDGNTYQFDLLDDN